MTDIKKSNEIQTIRHKDSIILYSEQRERKKEFQMLKKHNDPKSNELSKIHNESNSRPRVFPDAFVAKKEVDSYKAEVQKNKEILSKYKEESEINKSIHQEALQNLTNYLSNCKSTEKNHLNNDSFHKSIKNIKDINSLNKSRSKSKSKNKEKTIQLNDKLMSEVKRSLIFNNESKESNPKSIFNLIKEDYQICSKENDYYIINKKASYTHHDFNDIVSQTNIRPSLVTMNNLPISHIKDEYEIYSFNVLINNQYNKIQYFSPSVKAKADLLEKELTKTKEELSIFKSELKNVENQRYHLHKYIESLKGNIRIFLRVKPNLSNQNSIIQYWNNNFDDKGKGISLDTITLLSNGIKEKDNRLTPTKQNSVVSNSDYLSSCFHFNRVFSDKFKQEDIFNEVKPLLVSALDGENVCIFAYGATGSGKTYTMQGKFGKKEHFICEDSGILPRISFLLFEQIEKRKHFDSNIKLSISAIEIYNDSIFDLLDDGEVTGIMKNKQPVNIKAKENKFFIVNKSTSVDKTSKIQKGTTTVVRPIKTNKSIDKRIEGASNNIPSINKVKKVIQNNQVKNQKWELLDKKEDIIKFIIKAGEYRVTDSTKFNSESSRSHAIFQLKIQVNKNGVMTESLLNVIDLAGSEKSLVNPTDNQKEAEQMKKNQTEAGFINKSLTSLSRIINILNKKDGTFPPYRDSKLTQLLENSLNDTSKTAIIITVSNNQESYTQTKDSLCFAKKIISL